jgi:hypothetical protein
MSIRSDVVLQAIKTLAEQSRTAVRFMAVSSTDPRDLDTALTMVNGTEEAIKRLLLAADFE